VSTESRAAEPGELTCISEDCDNSGAPVAATVCPQCRQHTYTVPPESQDGITPPPVVRSGPSAGDLISRVIFGGFWSTVAVVALVASGLAVNQGSLGGGLIALGVALLCGLYARYIFRGGRFRILFW
jgi:hypothetical protein